jgi:adenylate cyclase
MDDRKRVAAIIRDYLARERLSREQFAFKSKLGKSTVDKLLIGLFSDKTLSIVEGYTGLSLRTSAPPEQPRRLALFSELLVHPRLRSFRSRI